MNTIDNIGLEAKNFFMQWHRRNIFAAEYRPDDLFEKLDGLPGKIRDMTISVDRMNRDSVSLDEDVDLIKAEVLDEICSELNDKDKPVFSNETSRRNELTRRLAEHQGYRDAQKRLREQIEQVVNNGAEVEALKMEYRITNLKIKTYNAELGAI